MFLEDRITKGGEIIQSGKFEVEDNDFYLFLMPKKEDSASIAVLDCKISFNDKNGDFPFTVGYWNPVLVDYANISVDILNDYRVFYGLEYK